jgi:hypothetical protein
MFSASVPQAEATVQRCSLVHHSVSFHVIRSPQVLMTSPLRSSACDSTGSAGPALIAISGIDGSRKGNVSAQLAETLAGKGFRVAVIAAEGWLNFAACPLRG